MLLPTGDTTIAQSSEASAQYTELACRHSSLGTAEAAAQSLQTIGSTLRLRCSSRINLYSGQARVNSVWCCCSRHIVELVQTVGNITISWARL